MGDYFDENWIGYDECYEIGCGASFTYDYGVQYSGGYIGFVFGGQGPLSVSLRYIKEGITYEEAYLSENVRYAT
jgi:hypothetical protein